MSFIQNVTMEKTSMDVRLSTTGIYSCLSIIILLNNNQTFVYHMDPSKFDLETDDIQTEIQKFIKTTISKFNKCGKSDLSFEKIYLIGGLNNKLYAKLNTELDRMKENYSTVSSIIDGLNVDDLRNFLKAIEYSNLPRSIKMGSFTDRISGAVIRTVISLK